MAVEPFSNRFRQSSSAVPHPAAVDQESLWIGAAMAHIKERGHLDGLPSNRSERLAVMTTVVRRGLVCWDKTRDRYVLTHLGQKHLDTYFPGVTKSTPRDTGLHYPEAANNSVWRKLVGTAAAAAICVGMVAFITSSLSRIGEDSAATRRPPVATNGSRSAMPFATPAHSPTATAMGATETPAPQKPGPAATVLGPTETPAPQKPGPAADDMSPAATPAPQKPGPAAVAMSPTATPAPQKPGPVAPNEATASNPSTPAAPLQAATAAPSRPNEFRGGVQPPPEPRVRERPDGSNPSNSGSSGPTSTPALSRPPSTRDNAPVRSAEVPTTERSQAEPEALAQEPTKSGRTHRHPSLQAHRPKEKGTETASRDLFLEADDQAFSGLGGNLTARSHGRRDAPSERRAKIEDQDQFHDHSRRHLSDDPAGPGNIFSWLFH
jgi:hypothetical protein